MPNTAFFLGAATAGGGTVTGLVAQWQSDVGVSVSGSNITSIADQSGNGYTLSPIDGSDPQLVASVLNGYPVIQHDATGRRLQNASVTGLTGLSDFSVVLVRSPYDQGGSSWQLMADVNNGLAQLAVGNGDAGDYRVGGYYTGGFRNTNAVWRGHSSLATYDIVIATRASGVVTWYKNGAVLTPTFSASDGGSVTGKVTIGGDSAGNIARGTWAQCRVYDHALDSAELSRIFSDLGTMYNIGLRTTAGTALNRAGWTVTASRSDGSHPTSNAVDGNVSTGWFTGGSVSPGSDYFEVDIGSAATVGGIQVDNTGSPTDTPTAGDFQYSDNNSTWTTIASWTTSSASTIQGSWTPVSHRYWRLLAQASSQGGAGNWWWIGEINLYSDAAP